MLLYGFCLPFIFIGERDGPNRPINREGKSKACTGKRLCSRRGYENRCCFYQGLFRQSESIF